MKTQYVDIHCHTALKPYSKSFKYDPAKQNSRDRNRKNSIWHYSPPTKLEKFINRLATLTKFTQTDLTTLAKSGTSTIIVSLYPFEKHFLSKRILGWKGLTDLLVNLASSVSQKRIDYIIRHQDYFEDLVSEYQYYLQLHNQVQQIDNKIYTYRVVSGFSEIEQNRLLETETKKIINIILSVEGGHSFNTGLDLHADTAKPTEVLENVRKVKNWQHAPIFLTFAHHFYNELCGHARSISIGLLKKNQDRGLNQGITPLGTEVLKLLLDKTSGKRILIDIKHMSRVSRIEYYKFLETHFANETIPIIVSHGAVNGYMSITKEDRSNYPEKLQNFNNSEINFYDDEILKIARSNGLFGLQLDERRIGSKKAIRKSKVFFPNKRKQLRKKSLLVWRQIEYMAEVLDSEGLFCWGIQCIGSDFDGIIDPLNGIWTAENIKDLGEELLNHANNYMSANRDNLQAFNRLSGETIVENVLRNNALRFIEQNY